jgi:RNA polymerase-binding transcription factor DksA
MARRNACSRLPGAVRDESAIRPEPLEGTFAREAVRRTLEAKRLELALELASYDGIRVTRAADAIDDIGLAADREMATDLERRSFLMREIADALVRLGNGEYGLCVGCGLEIAAARLASVPWTPHCLRCQEVAERRLPGRLDSRMQPYVAGGDPP